MAVVCMWVHVAHVVYYKIYGGAPIESVLVQLIRHMQYAHDRLNSAVKSGSCSLLAHSSFAAYPYTAVAAECMHGTELTWWPRQDELAEVTAKYMRKITAQLSGRAAPAA